MEQRPKFALAEISEDLRRKIEEKEYTPKVIEYKPFAGVTLNNAAKGEKVLIAPRFFTTSYDLNFSRTMENMSSIFNIKSNDWNINQSLIFLEENNKAKYYSNYPIKLDIKTKGISLSEPGTLVKEEDIADITSLSFQDQIINLTPKKGDKIIWFFRIDYAFGLFIDITGELSSKEFKEYFAKYWKQVKYHHYFYHLSQSNFKEKLFKKGFFPFLQILPYFNDLIRYFTNSRSKRNEIAFVIAHFTKEKIENFSNIWYSNRVYADKKKFIVPGLDAYYKENWISSISTLTPQIEGILRKAIFHEDQNDKQAKTIQLMKFIKEQGEKEFSTENSLAFPSLFYEYLDKFFFASFQNSSSVKQPSRHAVAHGVLSSESYTKELALKVILILDQIYFYLSSR